MFLGGEAGAALDAAALEDLLAGFAAVALHEAMLDLALALVGLISSFRHNYYPFALIICRYLF